VKLPGPERAKRVKYVLVGIIPNFYIVVTVFFLIYSYHSVVLWLLFFFFNKCIPLFNKDALNSSAGFEARLKTDAAI